MRLNKPGIAGIVMGTAGAALAIIFSLGLHQSVPVRDEGLLLLGVGTLFVLGDVLIRRRR